MNPGFDKASDGELVRETLAGSLEAYDQLVLRYEKRLYAFLRTCCRSDIDARELTQETFVKAFHALAGFHLKHSFPGWLFAIARNAAIDRFRAAPPLSSEPPPEAPDDRDPGRLLGEAESSAAVWNWARSLLGDTEFQALWLKYTQDMDVAALARVLGKSRIHAKVILFRARQRLGRALREAAPGGDLRRAWETVLSGEAGRPAGLHFSAKQPPASPVVLNTPAPERIL